MKIRFNELDKFLKMKKDYCEDLKKRYSREPQKFSDHVYLKLLNEPYIKNCKEIIKNELIEGTKSWMRAKSYFETPYFIFIWDDEKDKDGTLIEWEENIFDISIEKLYKILEENNKKYLILYGTVGIGLWNKKLMELKL